MIAPSGHCAPAAPALVDGRLSVIVRFHDVRRAGLLDQALFSLALQDHPDLEVLLVLQRPDDATLALVDELARGQPWRAAPPHRIVPVEVPAGADGRARLLNEGLARATGRYVAFLDDDDVVYHRCYTALIERLRASSRVVALGGARLARCRAAGDHLFVVQKHAFHALPVSTPTLARLAMFDGNYAPIHSFVIDRARLGDFSLRFDERLSRLEDYDLLLRLFAAFEPDVALIGTPLVEYRVRSDGSNTVVMPGDRSTPLNEACWKESRAEVKARKDELVCAVPLSVLAEVHRELEALREALREVHRERADRDGKLGYRFARTLTSAVQRTPRLKRVVIEAATRLDRWRTRRDGAR